MDYKIEEKIMTSDEISDKTIRFYKHICDRIFKISKKGKVDRIMTLEGLYKRELQEYEKWKSKNVFLDKPIEPINPISKVEVFDLLYVRQHIHKLNDLLQAVFPDAETFGTVNGFHKYDILDEFLHPNIIEVIEESLRKHNHYMIKFNDKEKEYVIVFHNHDGQSAFDTGKKKRIIRSTRKLKSTKCTKGKKRFERSKRSKRCKK